MITQRELRMRVLEYINDNDQGLLNDSAELGPLYETFGENDVYATSAALVDDGLITRENSLGGGYHIAPAGRDAVEEMRARRTDRGYRRRECREQVLRYLDQSGRSGDIVSPTAFAGSVDGVSFTNDDLQDALNFLIENDFIALGGKRLGNGDVYVARLGTTVSDCVDSGLSIQDFLARQRGSGVNNVFNMGGSNNHFATAAGPGSTATINTFNPEYADLFARLVRAAEADLQLTEEAAGALAELEASKEDPTRAQRAMAVLYTQMGNVTGGAAGSILGTLGAMALGIEPS